ncbi:MAG: RluA family pseudouridine synthase, partial [Rickettsiales bacterium]
VLYARYGKNLSDLAGEERIGIVHRLDKDTSGLMLVAKNNKAHHSLSKQLEIRTLKRTYFALTYNMLVPPIGTITTHVAKDGEKRRMVIKKSLGRIATTHYKTVETFYDRFSLLELELETGRTHQIRVHMEHKRTPIIGDPIYGKSMNHHLVMLPKNVQQAVENFPRQALHARKISFIHPTTKETLIFEAPLPKDMDELLKILK